MIDVAFEELLPQNYGSEQELAAKRGIALAIKSELEAALTYYTEQEFLPLSATQVLPVNVEKYTGLNDATLKGLFTAISKTHSIPHRIYDFKGRAAVKSVRPHLSAYFGDQWKIAYFDDIVYWLDEEWEL